MNPAHQPTREPWRLRAGRWVVLLAITATVASCAQQPRQVTDLEARVQRAAARAVPAVATIRARWGEALPGVVGQELRERSGTAVLIHRHGILLTARHVVLGAVEIEVSLADGRTFNARVVAEDPTTDIAVLRLIRPPADLPVMALSSQAQQPVGGLVLAIGNHFGRYGQTVSLGVVSALGRAHLGAQELEDFLQTDAAANKGSSGGALVDLNGALVGIVTAIASKGGGADGVSLAVPVGLAERVARQLLERGAVHHGFLGVVMQEVDADMAEALRLPRPGGTLVGAVAPGSPAARAGLRPGDVITAVDGVPVRSAARLAVLVAADSGDAPRSFEVSRDGSARVLRVQLRSRRRASPRSMAHAPVRLATGIAWAESPSSSGLVIGSVRARSAADRAGLRVGDRVTAVERAATVTPAAFDAGLARRRRVALLSVRRGGANRFVALRVGLVPGG